MVENIEGTSGDSRRIGGGAIASITGVGILVIFMLQNTNDVQLDFLFWSFTWPLWLLSLVMALVGAFAWFGLGVLRTVLFAPEGIWGLATAWLKRREAPLAEDRPRG